ncbi:hypothetical protein HK100_006371 [Physocladia obscura]|uniref:Uncharacterized protein n=1 Tax=Physocladia obscura TaxID=109957 RepID=A0AAD5T7S4_9FUNG|nr:hypothetical protein HK100_006371 [Physocladia obscura]
MHKLTTLQKVLIAAGTVEATGHVYVYNMKKEHDKMHPVDVQITDKHGVPLWYHEIKNRSELSEGDIGKTAVEE